MAARRNGRALAIAVTAPVRCAAYCRVSTEAQADKEFNSIEAQLQACETYVSLHREEGWTVVGERYQDAGFSGSTTNRPGLQRLLGDIEAGKIDVLVVYKYDRLSRSMLDFLQLLDFLKRHRVSFVSVSQRFDTSTPVGEMTVNILLSFAQFERQIIAERTRDKIHACRRRGRWTGGMPPLGYDIAPEGSRLTVNKDEATLVRQIFELYTETPSLVKVAQELNRRGWLAKSWTTRGGKLREGQPWNRVSLGRLLTNPIYLGQITLGSETFAGEHDAIVPKALFEKVQKAMSTNRRTGGASARNRHGALLRGLLRCAACDRAMPHAPTRAHGKLYRRYVCQRAMKEGAAACPTKGVNAEKVEGFVVAQIRRIGASPELQEETFRQATLQVKARRRGLKLEAKRLADDLARARGETERWVNTLSRTTGPAADAVTAELSKAQGHAQTLESRQTEVAAELDAIKAQDIDRDELARALAAFDPIWEVLLTPERERVLRLLIEKIDYNGATGALAITWRLSGFGELAAEVAP